MGQSTELPWEFELYLSTDNKKDDQISALDDLCQRYLDGQCHVAVIDVIKNPDEAVRNDIIATPTLLKKSPPPARRLFGRFDNYRQLASKLSIKTT